MGLFGIFAHGITETWVMEKALIGLVACEKERHTAANIEKWTEETLKAIGFTHKKLLGEGRRSERRRECGWGQEGADRVCVRVREQSPEHGNSVLTFGPEGLTFPSVC